MEVPLGFTIIDNVFDSCNTVIDWMESHEWKKSVVGNGTIDDIRQSYTLNFPLLSFAIPSFVLQMNRCVWEALDEYAKDWNFVFTDIENVSVQRYRATHNEHYGLHVDAAPNYPRVASALLYLNNVEEGGETFFPHFDFAIKPIEGRLVIFPSNFIYAHEARPPSSGVKYAAAYWARG